MADDYLTSWQEIQSKWDQAQRDGVFAKTNEGSTGGDHDPDCDHDPDLGMSPAMARVAANSEAMSDADYWAAVAYIARVDAEPAASGLPGSAPGVLSEAGSIATPNPVNASAKGQDSALVVTPDFSGGPLFTKLERLKLDLHELGDKLAGAGATGGEKPLDSTAPPGGDVLKRIQSLYKQVDELSNAMSPGTIDRDSLS